MKSYSLELVQRKTGSGGLGKLAVLAALGAGAYYGYKKLTGDKKTANFADSRPNTAYDAEAHEGESFTQRILKAAKRTLR